MSGFNIPWSRPDVGQDELNEIISAFSDDWLTMGPRVSKFEAAMAEYLQVKHAVAMSNGSVAIDIALQILGVGVGDEVIVPSLTYFATAAAVSRIGAEPVFVDVERGSFCLSAEQVENAIGPRTKGIIFIDYGGNPADIDALNAIAKKHEVFLLQDAAQSLGGSYRGKPLGAQTPISTMSFHMAKVMTTVEGGMLFTHDDSVAREARIYRNQGESAKYMHARVGHNARMNDVMASIGVVQARKLPGFLVERKRIAERYNNAFSSLGVEFLSCKRERCAHANFLYTIMIEGRDRVAAHLKEQSIDTRVCYPMPLYKQELYAKGYAPFRALPSPNSEYITERVLNLPIFPTMTNEQVDRVVSAVKDALCK